MMKSLHTFLLFSFLLSSGIFLSADAQNITVVTPDNAVESGTEIKSLLGNRIEISHLELKGFYQSLWPNSYDSNLINPEVEYTDATNQDISFDWNQTATYYKVRALSLTNITLTERFINHPDITMNLPNDLYLFSFQSRGGGGILGAAYIIIIEKPVKFNGKDFSCDCPNKQELWTSNIVEVYNGLTESDSYAWQSSNQDFYYLCEIDFNQEIDPNYNDASFMMDIQFDGSTPTGVTIPENCENYIEAPPVGNYISVVPIEGQETVVATLAFAAPDGEGYPSFTYFGSEIPEGENVPTGQITLSRCGILEAGNDRRNEINGKISYISDLKETSSSFSNLKELMYTLSKDEKVSIILYNNYGQEVLKIINQQLVSAGSHTVQVDIQNQPNGMYYCIMKTPHETKSLKLLKTY